MLVSASDGFMIDTEAPEIVFTSLGIFGNASEELIKTRPSVYQQEIDAIALEWNTTDDVSGTRNDTWMAGSLPLTADKHDVTVTSDTQIPLLAVTMEHAETVIFTVTSADMAGNVAVVSSPPLTIDITPPVVEGFRFEFIALRRRETCVHVIHVHFSSNPDNRNNVYAAVVQSTFHWRPLK